MQHVAPASVEAALPLVFLVEDEPGISNAIVSTLKRAGYDAKSFSDAKSVADALRGGQRPFLVLLDVTLENSDAVEVLQELSKHHFEGAVQLLSGNTAGLMDDVILVGRRRDLKMLPGVRKPCRMSTVRALADAERARQKTAVVDASPARAARNIAQVSLADALDTGRVEVWYQPKLDLLTGSLVGAECLARVRQTNGDLAMPGSFLPGAGPAEMERLTEVVMRRALLDWSDFKSSGAPVKLSVNVSCHILSTFPLAAILRENAEQSKIPHLILEITEEDALRDIQLAHEAATQLMIYGVELSIDDFGQGYSSISRLREVPFKEIKLDRSLVHNCASDKKAGALCKGVVDLAHSLNAVVVGEGIEQEADYEFLRRIGCDVGQGYLFGRPMPKDALLGEIASGVYRFKAA